VPFKLQWVEDKALPLSLRVEKMRLRKESGTIVVNETLTLTGIPAEAFDYALGTRSALEWVVDQYEVKTNTETGTVSDPNNPEDEEAIVRLVGQITTISVETVKLVKQLPSATEFRGLSLPAKVPA